MWLKQYQESIESQTLPESEQLLAKLLQYHIVIGCIC